VVKNTKISGIMSFLCFFASAFFTLSLMQTQGFYWWAKLIYCIYSIPTEYGKYHFSEQMFNSEYKVGWRVYCSFLALILFTISITASMVFSINQANLLENSLIKSSLAYKQQEKKIIGKEEKDKKEQAKISKETVLTNKKNEIENNKKTAENEINDLGKLRDSYPANYIDKRLSITKKIEERNNHYFGEGGTITIKEKEYNQLLLDPIENLIEPEVEVKKSEIIETKSTDGIISLFGNELNKKIAFFIISIGLEFTGIGFYVDYRRKKNKALKEIEKAKKGNNISNISKDKIDSFDQGNNFKFGNFSSSAQEYKNNKTNDIDKIINMNANTKKDVFEIKEFPKSIKFEDI